MRALLLLAALVAGMSFVSAEQPKLLWSFEANASINGVAISPAGDYVAFASESKVYLLNKSAAVVLENATEYKALSVALTPEGNLAAGDEYNLYLFEKSGRLISQSFLGDSVNDISIAANNIAVASSDRNVRLYDSSGYLLWNYTADSSARGVGMGSYIIAGTAAGRLYALSRSGELLWERELHRYISDVAAFGENSAVGFSKLVQFFRGREIAWEHTAESEVTGVAISPDGGYVAASAEDGSIYYLDSKGRKLWDYKFNSSARAVALSSHGERVAVGAGSRIYVLSPPDTSPPRITILSPKNGEKVSGIVEIEAEFNEQVASTAIYIDGNYACALPCKWDTSASSQGRHEITAKAVDASGNAAEAKVGVEVERKKIETLEINLSSNTNLSGIEEKAKNLTQNLTSAVMNLSLQNYSEAAKNASSGLKAEFRRIWWSSRFRESAAKILIAGIALVIITAYFKSKKPRKRQYRWKGR